MMKNKNNTTKKLVSFLASGKCISIVEARTNDLSTHGTTGGSLVQNLILHFGDLTWEEKNITDEIVFLDLLTLCKKFIDIYSVVFKIFDEDGKPLRNDKDVLAMMNEHENVGNIHIHLELGETLQPLAYKFPEDNQSFDPKEQDKYDEIVKTVQNDVSLSPIEVVKTCFGMKMKHFGDALDTQIKEQRFKINEKEEENMDLRKRVEEIESWMTQMKNGNQPRSHESPLCGPLLLRILYGFEASERLEGNDCQLVLRGF